MVMERARPTGYLGGSYTNLQPPIGRARDNLAQHSPRNQVHPGHQVRVPRVGAGLRGRANDRGSSLRRLRSSGSSGSRPTRTAHVAALGPLRHDAAPAVCPAPPAVFAVRGDDRDGSVGRAAELVHPRLRADGRLPRPERVQDRGRDGDARRVEDGGRHHRNRYVRTGSSAAISWPASSQA